MERWRFISAAAAALKDEGSLWMVANRQLPYEPLLEALFGEWRQVAVARGFKVLHACHPLPSSRPRVAFRRRKKGRR